MAPVQYHAGRFPPDERLDWPALIPFIGPAAAAVARYDGTLAASPNPRILLAPLMTREAVLSSRIEGTQATMGEVLGFEAGQEPDSPARRDDIRGAQLPGCDATGGEAAGGFTTFATGHTERAFRAAFGGAR